jgi:hypothetical protein
MEFLNAKWFDNKLLSSESILKEEERKNIINNQQINDIFNKKFNYISKLYKTRRFHELVEPELLNIDKYKEDYDMVDNLGEIENIPIEYNFVNKINKFDTIIEEKYTNDTIIEEKYTTNSIGKIKRKYNTNISNFKKIMKDIKTDANSDITVFLRKIIKLNIQDYLQNVKLWLDYNKIDDKWKRHVYISQSKNFWFKKNGK